MENTSRLPPFTPPASGPITVLLVDDQAIVGEAIRRYLANEPDMAFHFCSNPSEAVDTANRVRPTVILQDLVMPNLNGFSLVRRFRANAGTQKTPIIVLTSKGGPMFKSDAMASGANDFMVKLPSQAELIARIRAHARPSPSEEPLSTVQP